MAIAEPEVFPPPFTKNPKGPFSKNLEDPKGGYDPTMDKDVLPPPPKKGYALEFPAKSCA